MKTQEPPRIGKTPARLGFAQLVREVEEERHPYVVITDHRLPVAALVPVDSEGRPVIRR